MIEASVIKEIQAFCRDQNNPIARLNDMTWKGVGGSGDTHETCLAAVGRMINDDWTDNQIHSRIRRAKREACERAGETYFWPAETKVCQEWIDSAREKGFGQKKSKARASHGDLAKIVISRNSSIIKWDKIRRCWYVYNGKFWDKDATGELKTLIRQCLTDE